MKIYKKYDTQKNKEYNLLAKEYIEKNVNIMDLWVWQEI